ETDAEGSDDTEPRRVVDGLSRLEDLRLRAEEWRQVSQRRPGDGGGREIFVRALPRWCREASERSRQGRPGHRRSARAIRDEGAMAGFHDVLWHDRLGRGVDRAEEVR